MVYKLFIAATLLSFLTACGDTRENAAVDSISGDSTSGTYRSIKLPEPYATESNTNSSDVIGWEKNSTPVAPAGFSVEKYAGNLENPRWIYVLPNGDVLIAETKKPTKAVKKVVDEVTGKADAYGDSKVANRITLFRDTDNDGKPEARHIFLDGLDMPFGMLLIGDQFYVAAHNALWRYPYTAGATVITAKGVKLLDLPEEGRHWTRNIIANADGSKIYIAVGSASNVAEDGMDKEVRRACILEVNPDGTGERVYA